MQEYENAEQRPKLLPSEGRKAGYVSLRAISICFKTN
jgi:hypothetical protein